MSKMASRLAGGSWLIASVSLPSIVLVGAFGALGATGCGSNQTDVGATSAAYGKRESCKNGHWNEHGEHDGKHWCDDDPPPPPPPPPPEGQCDASVPPGPGTDGGTPGVCGFAEYNDGLVGGFIGDVTYDARTPGVAWATAGSQLFKSTDHGKTWAMVWEGPFAIRKLALPPGDPKVLLAATTSGVAKSTDGGATWNSIALDGLSITTLLVHPAQPLRVYAAVRGVGIIRSNDGGFTWGGADFGVPFGEFSGITTDPDNPDIVTVGMVELDGANVQVRSLVLRSTDAGVSWAIVHEIPTQTAWAIASCAANPDIVYAAMGKLAKSTDRGRTWTTLDVPAQDVAIAPSSCSRVYIMQDGVGVRRSDDGAATFTVGLKNGIPLQHARPLHVAVDPSDANRFIGSSQGGLLFSENAGANFELVGGVMGMAIRSLGASPTAPDELWLAAWGSGVWKRPSPAASWAKASVSFDYVFNVTPDPVVPSRTFVGAWAYPVVTTDGTTFTSQALTLNPMAFAVNPADTNVVYMATQRAGLHKSTNGGASWTAVNGTVTPWSTPAGVYVDFRTVLVDRNDPNRVLVGSNTRGLFRTEDGGSSLEPIAPSLSTKLIQCLVQTTDGAIYACVGGGGIAKTTDGGDTWSDASNGLASLNVQAIAVDSSGAIYATTNQGVFTSTNGGAQWSAFGSCLPPGGAGAAAVIGSSGARRLVVATSRGLFAHQL